MSNEIALIVIYNHKYTKNIDIINKIYKPRFSNIYHLVPFYEGNKENVIAVYESSYYFQGYIAQGFKQYYKDSYKHYFFIADDMIVNPIINENNYRDFFDLDDRTGFIPELDPMPGDKWSHNRTVASYNPYKAGVEIKGEIPTFDEAKKVIDILKVTNGSYSVKEMYFDNYSGIKGFFKQTINYLYDKYILKTNYQSSKYPFIRSYSDILIVSASSIKKFIHYCGAFAATDLWVEVAIPTALALSGEKIKVQADLKLQGRPLWSPEDYKLLDTFDYNLKSLLNNFPASYIYLHPIKLSKWNIDI